MHSLRVASAASATRRGGIRGHVGLRSFHGQHRTPIVPQVPVKDPPPTERINVGYLLHRNQIVKHTPHPLETELGYVLEREHQRYCRHEGSESATHFLATRGQSMDVLGRTDANQIKGNFFGLELYQDAMKVVLQRYAPEKRVMPADIVDPVTLCAAGPPSRQTLQRKLDDILYLIVREEVTGRWTIPQSPRQEHESLRMTVDRALSAHNAECYVWSNAPQVTHFAENENTRLFVYAATYLSGRPKFELMEPKLKDHAWVTRHEMRQYADDFASSSLLEALMDIAADSTFEA